MSRLARLRFWGPGEPRSRAELAALIKRAHGARLIDDDALTIMQGAMRVGALHVRDIMIPRVQIRFLKASAPLGEIIPQVVQSGHSRFPVVGDSVDDIRGILLAKDMLSLDEPPQRPLAGCVRLRAATIIPESKRVGVLLQEFREQRYHMALVVDEYGSLAGLLTIEDILEEIVGEIQDETDEAPTPAGRRLGDGRQLVPATIAIEQFNERFGARLPAGDYDTLGGLLMQHFECVPEQGRRAELGGLEFRVVTADSRRISQVSFSRIEPPSLEDGRPVVDAGMTVAAFNGRFGTGLQGDDSIAELLAMQLGRPPRTGDLVQLPGLQFELLEVADERIVQVTFARA